MIQEKTNETAGTRGVVQITQGYPASDGDGVKLTRVIGTPDLDMIDPFLMLDRFRSDDPSDYIGGFPSHPHRGFETVTYMLAGRMRHKDNAGHEGVIEPGGVQWMTAGRGIIHSEMPEQEEGLMEGFQLWINLPAAQKMTDPAYQEFPASEIPVELLADAGSVNVIAGITDRGTEGPVKKPISTPLFFDVILGRSSEFKQRVPHDYSAFVYVINGSISIGAQEITAGSLGVLSTGDHVHITSNSSESRFLLVAGKALKESVAKGGPFVMNTRQEVMQAYEDFRNGKF